MPRNKGDLSGPAPLAQLEGEKLVGRKCGRHQTGAVELQGDKVKVEGWRSKRMAKRVEREANSLPTG
jgi:hypothetical protein